MSRILNHNHLNPSRDLGTRVGASAAHATKSFPRFFSVFLSFSFFFVSLSSTLFSARRPTISVLFPVLSSVFCAQRTNDAERFSTILVRELWLGDCRARNAHFQAEIGLSEPRPRAFCVTHTACCQSAPICVTYLEYRILERIPLCCIATRGAAKIRPSIPSILSTPKALMLLCCCASASVHSTLQQLVLYPLCRSTVESELFEKRLHRF